ncbi:MAG: hypothetical protein HY231_26160 [Acidobacteria bacterium]|nr:hypothetical protein [Acidobacteriota bacterium]
MRKKSAASESAYPFAAAVERPYSEFHLPTITERQEWFCDAQKVPSPIFTLP